MKKLEIEGLQNEALDEASETNESEQEKNIKFSSKLVSYFAEQVKAFKKDYNSSLTVDQLKKVYCHGARLGKDQGTKDLNSYALARVHMFLRLKSGDKMTSKDPAKEITKATKLELEENEKCKRVSDFIDISEGWIPSENDFEKVQKEMDENDLKHEYENINELYLEYEPIAPKWD